jgi:DegV family protein with EDD domain
MITIVSDTTSCIAPDEAQRLGIPYLPQIIVIGDESYRDDTEIDSKTFLMKLRTSPVLPKTAAPPPALYNPIFEKYGGPGNTIIVVCPSAQLSGTVRNATVAAQDFPESDIHIVDTLTVGSGLGSIVYQANNWRNSGLNADAIIENILEMGTRWKVFFVVNTLEYLFKGGRIGAAQALFGSILQVKPILTIKQGGIVPEEKQRTQKKALSRLVELVCSDCPRGPQAFLTIMHSAAEDEANQLVENFKTTLGLSSIPISEVPPAIVVHAGPGVIAASYFSANME